MVSRLWEPQLMCGDCGAIRIILTVQARVHQASLNACLCICKSIGGKMKPGGKMTVTLQCGAQAILNHISSIRYQYNYIME